MSCAGGRAHRDSFIPVVYHRSRGGSASSQVDVDKHACQCLRPTRLDIAETGSGGWVKSDGSLAKALSAFAGGGQVDAQREKCCTPNPHTTVLRLTSAIGSCLASLRLPWWWSKIGVRGPGSHFFDDNQQDSVPLAIASRGAYTIHSEGTACI